MGLSKQFEDISPQSPDTVTKGGWGEDVAVNLMIGLGYGILERNWRSGHYEVDIIAQKGSRIVFVEVKTRSTAYIDPVMAVDAAKQRRIIRSADVYMQQYNIPFEYQFDIITVVGTRQDYEVVHIPDAFFPTTR